MYQMNNTVLTLLSTNGATDQYAPAYVDAAPSSIVGKRNAMIIVTANAVSGTTPSFGITLSECATTNGTYTAISGSSISAVTTNGVSSYFVSPAQRYIKCTSGTPTGTGTPTASIIVMMINEKREA